MRKITLITVGLSFFLFSTVYSSAASSYHMTDLGTLGGATSWGFGISPNGAYVVGKSLTSSGVEHAFLYHDGVMHDLGSLSSSGESVVCRVNDHGVAVGYSYNEAGNKRAVYSSVSSLSLIDMGTFGGDNSQAYSINAHDQIVGWADVRNIYGNRKRPFVTTAGKSLKYITGGWEEQSLSDQGGAYAINDNGTITGWWSSLYGSGQFVDNTPILIDRSLIEINNKGIAIASKGSHAELLDVTNPNNITILAYLDGDYGPAWNEDNVWSINNYDILVGYDGGSNAPPIRSTAFLYDTGMVTQIDKLVENLGTYQIGWAGQINDNGMIVGSAYTPDGGIHAILLTPIPEPSVMLLLGFGILTLRKYRYF